MGKQRNMGRSCLAVGSILQTTLRISIHTGFSLGLLFNLEDSGDVPPKRQFDFQDGVISQNTELQVNLRKRTMTRVNGTNKQKF
jgi:hypothetical protein